MDFYGTEQLMDNIDWTVQEDRSMLDNASKATIRQRFLDWTAAAHDEQGTAVARPGMHVAPRYTYCVHVDAEALQSVVKDAPQLPEPDFHGTGYVNLIDASWKLPSPEDNDPDVTGTNDPRDEGEPEVEGCKMYDVGWMKVAVYGLAPRTYAILQKDGEGDASYVRPPEVAIP